MKPSAEREFLEFVETSTPTLFRVAYALTGQQHAAEDLLQTALERVATRWQRIDDPRAYARRVMYHEQISWWRRFRRREVTMATPPEPPAAEDPAHAVVLRRVLHTALARLGPRQRAVLVLRYLEDRSEREVAELLGCSVNTVASQASRALSQLRAQCGPLLDVTLHTPGKDPS